MENANLIDVWTLFDTSGSVAVDSVNAARNGAYVGSPALQAVTFADGVNNTPSFVAANSQYVNVFSAGLAAAFSLAEGSLLIWEKLTQADWLDSNIHVLAALGADINNRLVIYKDAAPLTYNFSYVGGGTNISTASPTISAALSQVWLAFLMTWSTTGNRMRAYLRGTQIGADITPLPLWVGALATLNCNIASNRAAPANLSDGGLGFCALWTKELTPAEVLTVSTAP